jgi:Ca2+-binding EF-hand superfamily protein
MTDKISLLTVFGSLALIACTPDRTDEPSGGENTLPLSALSKRAQHRLASADANHDGLLSTREMARYDTARARRVFEGLDAKRAGKLELAALSAPARLRFAGADLDGDGMLTLDEIVAAHNARVIEQLRSADKNGDGALTSDEVGPLRWLRLRAADTDGDGKVTFAELQRAFAHPTHTNPEAP